MEEIIDCLKCGGTGVDSGWICEKCHGHGKILWIENMFGVSENDWVFLKDLLDIACSFAYEIKDEYLKEALMVVFREKLKDIEMKYRIFHAYIYQEPNFQNGTYDFKFHFKVNPDSQGLITLKITF